LATTPGNSNAITIAPWIPIPNAAKPKRRICTELCWVKLLVVNDTMTKVSKKTHSTSRVIMILLRQLSAVCRCGSRWMINAPIVTPMKFNESATTARISNPMSAWAKAGPMNRMDLSWRMQKLYRERDKPPSLSILHSASRAEWELRYVWLREVHEPVHEAWTRQFWFRYYLFIFT
jgi:hypothetical protein